MAVAAAGVTMAAAVAGATMAVAVASTTAGGGKHDGYRYGWYGVPYGYYGGGCGGLYRKAIATRSPYWWNRYYECTGYY